jgi:hypothetical protein
MKEEKQEQAEKIINQNVKVARFSELFNLGSPRMRLSC